MVVVKLMLPGVLCPVTSRPSSGDLCGVSQGFGIVPTTTILLAGVKRNSHPIMPSSFTTKEKTRPPIGERVSMI
jgi:hypothetical protein